VLIEEAHDNGARYFRACEVVGISVRTLQRWRREGLKDCRKGAVRRQVRKLSPEQIEEIISVCTERRFYDDTPHEIVSKLLSEGRYIASVKTFYRVLRKRGLLHHRSNTGLRKASSPLPEKIATGPNQIFCWDITYIPTKVKGQFFYAYVVIDIFDRYIVGFSVHEEESAEHSKTLFEGLMKGRSINLTTLHSDNGRPMTGITLLSFLHELRVPVSRSRPRISNDNPFIESFFKTVKYSCRYPRRFRDLNHARVWLADFVRWYNTEHLHSGIDYVTPEQMRTGEAVGIFRVRNETMKNAKVKYPERWGSRATRTWGAPDKVILNREVQT
jgi:transposase InsO family protein